MRSIDLNCDVGEGMGNEEALMPFISSANIACGLHAGDALLMREVVKYCKRFGVAIGAHPSFPDRENFGRRNMDLPTEEVYALVLEQIELLKSIAVEEGASIHHVKPHGALYNMAAADRNLSDAIARAVAAVDQSLVLYGLSGSVTEKSAKNSGLRFAHEVFADRTYQHNGSLTPRSEKNALITNPVDSVQQAIYLAMGTSIKSVDGQPIKLKANTICLHGDGADAVGFAKTIHYALKEMGIKIAYV
ncbi:MAG: LamB/YcsF family protein [Bacteroidetes bacterium]|nr:LamB/YcsF family protein [Bacteroidota bacterium]